MSLFITFCPLSPQDGIDTPHPHPNTVQPRCVHYYTSPLTLTFLFSFFFFQSTSVRNRWKNADDSDTAIPNNNNSRTTTTPLTDYDLDRILQTIFGGLEAGFQVAQQFVDEVRALAAARRAGAVAGDGNNNMAGNNNIDMDMDAPEEEEVEWGFMTEAMDWESV